MREKPRKEHKRQVKRGNGRGLGTHPQKQQKKEGYKKEQTKTKGNV